MNEASMEQAGNWQCASVSIAYRLGEVALASWKLAALVRKDHFTALTEDKGLENLPLEGLAGNTNALFIPCHPVSAPPPTIITRGDTLIYTPRVFKNYFVDFGGLGDFHAYLAQFSSKSRSTLLRKVRNFKKENGEGAVFREFAAGHDFDEFFRLAGPISAESYQERLLDAGLPRSPDFVAGVKAQAAREGALAWLLLFRGKPVSYVLSLLENEVATYNYVGYRADAQHLSPGTVLQYFILESLFDRKRVRIFDFTEGEGEHKRFFSTGSQLCAKSYVFRRTLLNRLRILLHRTLGVISTVITSVLENLGMKRYIRSLVRRIA